MSEPTLRVVVADDHPAILMGTRYALQDAPSIEVVGMAKDSGELMTLLESALCNVLVTDYSMPGGKYGDGITLFETVHRRFPPVKIVVMTMMDSPLILRPLALLGIRSIVSKIDDLACLIPAVHAAYAGKAYFSPTIAELARSLENSDPGLSEAVTLTKRELEIIRLYTSGLGINEIAERLNRSKQTVSSQKTSAMRKLGLERDSDLYKYAMESGLLSP